MSTWTYGGTALSTFGVVTQINEYLDFVPRRGEDQQIPYNDGRLFVKKYFESRTFSFGIAMKYSTRALLQTALDDLRKLLTAKTEQTLSATMEDASVRTALASVNRSMQVKRIGNDMARVVVEFSLAKPFMRSSVLTTTTTTIDASPKAYNLTNPGTADDRTMVITLTGPLDNTVITNTTNSVVLTYTGTIGAGASVTINIANFTAVTNAAVNVIGNVSHSGDPHFMVLLPGVNSMSVADDTATTGTVKVEYYAPFH